MTSNVRTWLLAMAVLGGVAVRGAMIDPAIDDPAKEWCYFGRTTTVIGLPFCAHPIQFTFDGSIYSRFNSELAFFIGKDRQPVLARQRVFAIPGVPVVTDSWTVDGVEYTLEVFTDASVLAADKDWFKQEKGPVGDTLQNPLNWARLSARNTGKAQAEAVFGAFSRITGDDYRSKGSAVGLGGKEVFAFGDHELLRDGNVVYRFSGEPEKELQLPGPAPRNLNNASRGIVTYRAKLAPGAAAEAEFCIRKELTAKSEKPLPTAAAYAAARAATVSFWQTLVPASFSIPEKRIEDSWKNAIVHMILATRGDRGRNKRQGSGLPYDGLFFTDFVDMHLMYDVYGMPDYTDVNLRWMQNSQNGEGMFQEPQMWKGRQLLISHGQGFYTLAHHAVMSHDPAFAAKLFTNIVRAAQFVITDRHAHTNGLLRGSLPYDNEMIAGQYTCHNLWCLAGLRNAVRVARMLGKDDQAKAWTAEADAYAADIIKAIDAAAKKNGGFVPSGLDDFKTGEAARHGFGAHNTDQDWENVMLVYPTEILAADDPRVAATINEFRMKYREGVMTYRFGRHIHQYITFNVAHQELAIGDEEDALRDFYHIILHNGSTGEGFENMIEPWNDRTAVAGCPPPHAWAAAKTALFIRNCMVREEGGKCGMEEGKRGLVFFGLMAPAWTLPGQKLAMKDAATEFGTVTAACAFGKDGFSATFGGGWNAFEKPAFLAIPIPWYKKAVSVSAKGGKAEIVGARVVCEPSVTTVEVKWLDVPGALDGWYQKCLTEYRSEHGAMPSRAAYRTDKVPTPVLTPAEKGFDYHELPSFALTLKAWKAEYARRYAEFIKAGGKPVTVTAPAMK